MLARAALYTLLILIVSCAPTASGVRFSELPLSKIYTDTRAKIVVFRPNSVAGSGKPLEIKLDNKLVGSVMKGGYLIVDAEPGRRTVQTNTATIDLKEKVKLGRGETLFYKVDFDNFYLTGAWKLVEIDEKTVSKEFGDYQSSL